MHKKKNKTKKTMECCAPFYKTFSVAIYMKTYNPNCSACTAAHSPIGLRRTEI